MGVGPVRDIFRYMQGLKYYGMGAAPGDIRGVRRGTKDLPTNMTVLVPPVHGGERNCV